MYELALCASIGGLQLGLQRAGIKTACYVEYNDYRINVLMSRIRDAWLDDAPIWDDVTTFNGQPWRGRVAIISAGFPCQPFSQAGKRRGEDDERHLWPDICRIIRQVRPRYVLLENVSGLLNPNARRGQPAPLATVLRDLASCGYDAEWQSLPASAFGAPHERDRVFIVAYPHESRWTPILRPITSICTQAHSGWPSDHLDTPGSAIQTMEERLREPALLRSYDGVSFGMERLAAIGEAVVPQIGEYIGRCIVAANSINQPV